MQCTCLIPFFNERERIGKVLDQVLKIKAIDEIICIDDGSTDGTATIVKKYQPRIKLLTNPKNLGKTEAIKAGLKRAKGDYIFLLDADLRDFDYIEAEKVFDSILNKNIDMVILRHVHALWTMKLVRGDILISGDRIVKKTALEKILQRKVTKFQLEVAINKYMFDNKKNVYWMPSSARNTYKFNKGKFFQGWYEMTMVAVDIILYLGIKDYFRQLLFFCRKELT